MLLTRHNRSILDRSIYPSGDNLNKGAYTIWQSGEGDHELLMLATGSEVEMTIAAAEKPCGVGRNVRVGSMPSWELFEKQDASYQDSVIPDACTRRMVVEAGTSFGWERYVGRCGVMVTNDDFGASASFKGLQEKFAFTAARNIRKG